MNTGRTSIGIAALAALLLASCGSTQQVTQRQDDVYFVPGDRALQPVVEEETVAAPSPTEDYYDPEAAAAATTTERGYYDLTYNDPYFYNYGRFGFGTSLGWQSGWSDGWSSGGYSVWGYGSGAYSGWYMPGLSIGYGWGNRPWGWYYGDIGCWQTPGWNQFAWYNDPYYGYGNCGWGSGGYGYGNYWGPYGNCSSCYSPIVIASCTNTIYGHRPSIGAGNNRSNGTYQVRSTVRDPVRLAPAIERPVRTGAPDRLVGQSRLGEHSTAPLTRPAQRQSEHQSGERTVRPSRTTDGGGMNRSGGMERGSGSSSGGSTSGGGSAPSRSGGGGGSSSGGRRAR